MAIYLVTGVTGFVGKALALRLIKDGHQVRGIARKIDKNIIDAGINLIQHDLTVKSEVLIEAMCGVEGVFHVAAKVDMWGDYQDFYAANVLATKHLLEISISQKIPYFIYTSSPSVIAGSRDLKGVDESEPYPDKYLAHYPATKALAEQEVLRYGRLGQIKSIALRPHLIFGPGDTNLIPTIIERAKAGRLVRVGKGENLTDLTYIEDCIEAHILALKAIKQNPAISGQSYFISQGEPVNLWGWVDMVLERCGMSKITRSLPKSVAYSIAVILEKLNSIFLIKKEPLLTRFLVCEMATSHYFNIAAAKNDLGYYPKYSIDQALEETFDSYKKINSNSEKSLSDRKLFTQTNDQLNG